MRRKLIHGAEFILLAVLLASCFSKTSELYPSGAYIGDLEDVFLRGYHKVSDPHLASSETFAFASDRFFDGFRDGDLSDGGGSFLHHGPRSLHPEIFSYDDGSGPVSLDASVAGDWSQDLEGQSDQAYIGKSFGRTKCLVKRDPAFANGLLSKLYNGQMYCLGLHSKALVQLAEEGMDAVFPKTLAAGDCFLVSFRGGSIFGEPRITSIDLTVTLYKGSAAYEFVFPDLSQWTDNGGDGESFFGFSLKDLGFDPEGITGFGLSYKNLRDENLSQALTDEQRQNPNSYWAMLVYEVMLPDSTWR
jgi:hypothetical protein